jgi:hypothetical protein
MKEHRITRDAASEALIALRTAMEMTQAQFAVQVVDTAVTTIARWETTHPPQGDLLLRLGEIARQQGMPPLRDFFRGLYAKEVLGKLGFDLMMIPKTETEAEHGYLMFRLEGIDEIRGAQRLMDIIWRRRSPDPESRKAGAAELSSLLESGNTPVDKIRAAVMPHISGEQTAPISVKEKSHGKTKKR